MEIPYRVIDVASGDLGSSANRKFDIEAWIPTQDAYREVTSTSNCAEFQARRLNIRFKEADATKVVATLNGTLVAIPRMVVAILENHQNADGTVNIPAALQPFLGTKRFELV
jgi:seryl-tRNA synthetase